MNCFKYLAVILLSLAHSDHDPLMINTFVKQRVSPISSHGKSSGSLHRICCVIVPDPFSQPHTKEKSNLATQDCKGPLSLSKKLSKSTIRLHPHNTILTVSNHSSKFQIDTLNNLYQSFASSFVTFTHPRVHRTNNRVNIILIIDMDHVMHIQ